MNRPLRTALILISLAATAAFSPLYAGPWSRSVQVTHEGQTCVAYRARHAGGRLIVEVSPGKGWHTFAMDNLVRAAEKLAGRKSLGSELPTEITVGGGLEITGPWFQTTPRDFSKPEQRWYSWGFDRPAVFLVGVRPTGDRKATVAIRGQACTPEVCRNLDVSLEVTVDRTPPGSTQPPVSIAPPIEEVRR